jgi:4-diphosphocytidyl-2-C-methyl-D-erythritol kinase
VLRALYDVPAPAKLNLFLHVVGRRADGYHQLRSLFVLVDWCDALHFERRGDGAVRRHDLAAGLPADDLIVRAARLLQRESGTALGADIAVAKHVPWGAGLGGGSSDAASTLLALNRLWGLGWPRQRLAALGLVLGADVPFFIGGRNALVEGIGERLTPAAVPAMSYAVVKPAQAISTAAVFSRLALVRETSADILSGFSGDGEGRLEPTCAAGRNDLQCVAQELVPEVAVAARWLLERFGNSRMTGSGSAVFAEVGLEVGATADPQATELADLPAGWVGRRCRSLPEHPLVDWAD